MRILVIYATRLGSTREIAERLTGALHAKGFDADPLSADDPGLVTGLPDYDAYVIGSAVYAGHWLAPAIRFVRRHEASLARRPVWLFSSGPVGKTAVTHEAADPKEIAELWTALRPRDHRVFAGALDREDLADANLGRVERFVAEHLVPEGDFRDWPAIDAWAHDIAHDLGRIKPIPRAERSTVG